MTLLKSISKSIGRSMAALLAMERDLWLNLSNNRERDESLILDAPHSPPGLFGNAVNSVVQRFQEAKKQGVAFQKFHLCRSQVPGAAGSSPSRVPAPHIECSRKTGDLGDTRSRRL